MIYKEAWYVELDAPPDAKSVATTLWSELQTRKPLAEVKLLTKDQIYVSFEGYSFIFRPLDGGTHEVLSIGGIFEERPDLAEEYGIVPGAKLALEDITRFVIDRSSPQRWSDQVASQQATSKYLLKDKRQSGKPNKAKLEVRSFQPHFGVGPTYWGIIDTSRMSWLKDHEYKTKARAETALRDCKSGRAEMEFRGF